MGTQHNDLRLAYLTNTRFPSERAHASQIAHMCQAFASLGIAVDVIANKRVSIGAQEFQNWMGCEPRFAIQRVAPGWFYSRPKIFFYISEVVFTLSTLLKIRQKKYDIIYCRNEWVVYLLSLCLKNDRLVWESHEAKLHYPARKILQKGIRTVVISDGIYEDYVAQGVPPDQLCVAYDGISEDFFTEVETRSQARARLGLEKDGKIAMYIGGFANWKGVHVFAQAAEHTPEWQFVAIGGDEVEIQNMSQRYPDVRFMLQTPYRDLRHNQQAADVLVVPNTDEHALSSRYTSPLKLFAHMASGVPLLISDVPSLTSVVGADEAVVCKAGSAQSLTQALSSIAATYDNAQANAVRLRARAQQYTWTKRAEKIITALLDR